MHWGTGRSPQAGSLAQAVGRRVSPTSLKGVMIMDYTTIMQLIGSLGFPIVACIALFWQLNKANDAHKEEMNEMRKSIDNNTQALIRLVGKLDADSKKGE